MQNRNGFTLLELLIASAVGTIVTYAVGVAVLSVVSSTGALFGRNDYKSGLSAIALNLLQTGRLATACAKQNATTLQCGVDFEVPPLGNLTNVQYSFSNGTLTYLTQNGGNWVTGPAVSGVTSFILCDETDMTTGTCPIAPVQLSSVFTNFSAIVPLENRFFRFSITGSYVATQGQLSSTLTVQSSFYVRNPSPFPNIVYQWGSSGGN